MDFKQEAERYRASLSDTKNEDMFSLGYQWADKPHRHVFDLCKLLEKAQEEITTLRAENAKIRTITLNETKEAPE